jgi:CRISPR-associated protein Cas1
MSGTGIARAEAARRRLASPTLAMLPRVADSLSFLYLDAVRIVQDDTGVCARVGQSGGGDRVYLPTAALSCVLLGPGTSITQPALATLARHGTTVVCTGSGTVRAYAGIQPSSLTTEWLERQVRAWTVDAGRLAVATRMYEMRFDTDLPTGTSLAQMRGLEGQRVKALYRMLAEKYRITRFRRNYDPDAWDTQDPVNLALSAANTCLYGVVHSAVLALGCSPALGFIHSGTQHAFVYDVADLYKTKMTIPIAFAQHAATKPQQTVRRHLREHFRLFRLLPRIVTDIQYLLDPSTDHSADDRGTQMVHLWDPELGALPAGVNYAENDE